MARTPKKRSARAATPKEEVSLQHTVGDFAAVRAAGAAGEELAKAEDLARQLERTLNGILSAHAAALEGWQIGALEHLRTAAASGLAQLRGHQAFLLISVGSSPEVTRG